MYNRAVFADFESSQYSSPHSHDHMYSLLECLGRWSKSTSTIRTPDDDTAEAANSFVDNVKLDQTILKIVHLSDRDRGELIFLYRRLLALLIYLWYQRSRELRFVAALSTYNQPCHVTCEG